MNWIDGHDQFIKQLMEGKKMKYVCGDRFFYTLEDARQYANFINKVSGIILGIEEIKNA